jgi:hypothetical protein
VLLMPVPGDTPCGEAIRFLPLQGRIASSAIFKSRKSSRNKNGRAKPGHFHF